MKNIFKLTRSFNSLKIRQNNIKFDSMTLIFLLQIHIKSTWKKAKILFLNSFTIFSFPSTEVIEVRTDIIFFHPILSWIWFVNRFIAIWKS